MEAIKKEITIRVEKGIHLIQAQEIVEALSPFQSRVFVELDGNRVNAKSIMGLLTLAAPCGGVLRASAEGPDAEAALNALEKAV